MPSKAHMVAGGVAVLSRRLRFRRRLGRLRLRRQALLHVESRGHVRINLGLRQSVREKHVKAKR